jgi:HlyD family secretion protein
MAKSRSSGGLIITLVVLVGAAAGGWYYWSAGAEKAPEFITTTVGRGDVVQVVTATGGLQPLTSVDVSSQVSGLITEVNVDYNTVVKAGQVLCKLDPATYQSKLEQATAQLANTQANTTLIRLNTDRTRDLRAKNLVAQQDLDTAEAQLAQAEAQLKIQQANVESAKVDLSRCTIYSPLDGIVIDRIAEKGKTVAASLNAPTIFTIVDDLAKMQIDAAVAEADIGGVEIGQQVNFTVDAFPGRQFRGVVSQIRNAPKTVSNVVTYDTIIDVNNADLKLKPGMTANVSIVIAQRLGTMRVSNSVLRVRMPDDVLQSRGVDAPAAAAGEAKAPAPKAPTDERAAMRDILREAGQTPGTPPTPEIIQRAQQIAKDRGLELDFSRMGRGRGGDRASGSNSNAPVTRPVYRLVGSDPKTAKIETARAQLGISDGIYTEVLGGLKENDVLITAVTIPGASSSAQGPQSQVNNPFAGGGRPGFGGGGGGRGR